MHVVRSIDQLRLGRPVVYRPQNNPDVPVCLVVAKVYDDPDAPAWTARTAVLRLRPADRETRYGYRLPPVLVRQQNLTDRYGVPWWHLTATAQALATWRNVQLPDCEHCTRAADVLDQRGAPVCAMHRRGPASARESAGREWSDNAVARLYSALGLV